MSEPVRETRASSDLPDPVWRVLLVLTTVRAHSLLFSVPYLVVWTRGFDPIGRTGLLMGHACAVLALGTFSDAVDAGRGLAPRIALVRDPRWHAIPLSRVAGPVMALIAVLAGLLAGRIHPLAPVGVLALIGAAWAAARLPVAWKYLTGPELGLPVLLLAAPAGALAWLTDASIPWLSLLSGAGCLAALVLASHLRDRERDMADDVPTLATRRPRTARGWMWVAGLTGAIAGIALLEHPLAPVDRLALLGGLGVLAGLPAGRYRVPVLVVAHALLAVAWMLG